MRVLVACEFSGRVRDAFLAKGHDAVSCDLLPTEAPGPHIQGDVREVLDQGWDLMIAHPPCQRLTSCGRWYWKNKPDLVNEAVDLFMSLVNAPIPKWCIENPAGIMSRRYRKPNQVIHPWYFEEPAMKRTCLRLRGLPRLNGSVKVARDPVPLLPVYTDKSGKKRYFTDAISGVKGGKARSMTFASIANAMAAQWG